MSWDDDGKITKTYNHNNGNSNNNSRRPKLINLSINNRSGHFEKLTKAVKMIKSVFNNTQIGHVLSTIFV